MQNDGTIDLDCGIAITRIEAWFDNDLALPRAQGGWLYAEGESSCRIELDRLNSRPLGAVQLERTRLIATGDEHALDSFYHAFTLKFLSAGG